MLQSIDGSPQTLAAPEHLSYLKDGTSVMSWLNTRDHKRVGIMFLVMVTLGFILGGVFALALRLKLLQSGPFLFDAMTYNRLFTLHGIVMIFFFMIPAIPSGFGNFVLPLMIGARDVAFPRLNLGSFYVYLLGVALALWGMILVGNDPRRPRHRLDLLYTLLLDHHDHRRAGDPGPVHHRLLLDHDRPELHRHRTHAARAGHDLDAHAAVRLGHLRHQHHPGAGDAGAGSRAPGGRC
jgi:hypothetical protein